MLLMSLTANHSYGVQLTDDSDLVLSAVDCHVSGSVKVIDMFVVMLSHCTD